MEHHFTAIFKEEEGWFIAWVEELPGVNTQGKTLKETKENLKEALQLILLGQKNLSRSWH